jgi:hypothetical protein
MKKSEKYTVSKILRLPDEINDRIKAMADDRGISQNEFIIKAINAYLESNNNDDTGLVSMDSITTDIDDRFEALEREVQAIKEQLNADKSPPKTPPKKAKTIAPGEGTIAKVRIDWKSLIREFPDKDSNELCKIGMERYPEKEEKDIKDNIRRAINRAKKRGELTRVNLWERSPRLLPTQNPTTATGSAIDIA